MPRWIDRLAGRRREPARLLLLGTYRPVDVIVREHPLQAVHRDLMLHGQSAELRLEGSGRSGQWRRI